MPGSKSALEASPLYVAGGPLRMFADQLLATCGDRAPTSGCVAVPRPRTPGYTVLTSQFAVAVSVALQGQDPAPALHEASRHVTEDLAANARFSSD